MRRLTIAFIAIFAIQISHAVFGQDVKIDLTEIDTGIVIMKTATTIDSSTTDTVVEVAISAAGKLELQLKYDSTSHSSVRFDVDSNGEISNVEWKPNTLDATEYSPLDTSLYQLSLGGSEISLSGCEIYIIDSLLSYDLRLEYYDPKSESTTFYGDPEEDGSYIIFPGAYLLTQFANQALIGFSVDDKCDIDSLVYWQPSLEDDSTELHPEFFGFEPEKLTFYGTPIAAKIRLQEDQEASLEGSTAPGFEDNVAQSLRLLPGTHEINVELSGVPSAMAAFEVLNSTARLRPTMYWTDYLTGRNGGEPMILEPGFAYLTPESFYITTTFPTMEYRSADQPYAVLKDKLDASYYIAFKGEVYLRYDERYNEDVNLNLKIFDMNYVELSLGGNVTRHYGANWIHFTLPSSGFVPGEYYVMEVRSEKGDLSMLRFRYDDN